jgi:hypothetical protein
MFATLSTRIAVSALFALALAGVAPRAAAQQLAPNLCPIGSPFKLNPPNWQPPVAGDIPMLRRTVDPVAYPNARCNDGSPAVLYFRPANALNPAAPPSTRWLIFFDGGGGCQDADSCLLTRWCSGGTAPFDRAGKMSSRGTPPAIRSPGGIFKVPAPAGFVNEFATYNEVLVHYCSSDNWTGSADHKGLAASNGTNFSIVFRGEAIVNAVVDLLKNGTTAGDPGTARYYATPLPDLLDATEILIGGESAGTGVRNHLDRLRDQLETEIAAAGGAATVRGVFDAGFTPDLSDPGIDWSDSYSPGDYDDYLVHEVQPVTRTFRGTDDSALDQSCLTGGFDAVHNALSGDPVRIGHPQACYDGTYIQLQHVTTPVFVRQDINDTLGRDKYVAWKLFPTLLDDYWAATHDQLVDFAAYTPAAGGLEPPLAAPGVMGPNCGQHVAIQTNNGFFRHTVTGPAYPTPLSFHDLLVNWLAGLGGSDTVQIQEDNLGPGAYSASFCP